MKFTEKDYKNLVECIENSGIDLVKSREHYIEKRVGLVPLERFVWDMFWKSDFSHKFRYKMDHNYKDTHYFTATKKAINQLINKK